MSKFSSVPNLLVNEFLKTSSASGFLKNDVSESDDEYYFKKTNNNKLKNTRKSRTKKNKVSKVDLNKDSPFYILKSLKS